VIESTGEALKSGMSPKDTTQMYLHANIELKEKALAKTKPFEGRRPASQSKGNESPRSTKD